VLFYAFSFIVKEDKLTQFDFNMTVKIQDAVPIRVDPHFSFLSILGSFEVTGIILVVFSVLALRLRAIFPIFMFCFMHVVEIIGKAFLDHPPTPFMFHRYALDISFPSGYVQPGGSYPSGHAMRTAYLIIFIGYVIWKSKMNINLKILAIGALAGIYLLMAISRISLGEHWTTDVIGGSLLGAAFAVFTLIFVYWPNLWIFKGK
jgi:membrane-associated phospholipid phosphatase